MVTASSNAPVKITSLEQWTRRPKPSGGQARQLIVDHRQAEGDDGAAVVAHLPCGA